jgi:hypothetical protein
MFDGLDTAPLSPKSRGDESAPVSRVDAAARAVVVTSPPQQLSSVVLDSTAVSGEGPPRDDGDGMVRVSTIAALETNLVVAVSAELLVSASSFGVWPAADMGESGAKHPTASRLIPVIKVPVKTGPAAAGVVDRVGAVDAPSAKDGFSFGILRWGIETGFAANVECAPGPGFDVPSGLRLFPTMIPVFMPRPGARFPLPCEVAGLSENSLALAPCSVVDFCIDSASVVTKFDPSEGGTATETADALTGTEIASTCMHSPALICACEPPNYPAHKLAVACVRIIAFSGI